MVSNNGALELTRVQPTGRMSERAFLKWYDEEEATRAEWEGGDVVVMAPENIYHNELTGFLYKLLDGVALKRGGSVFMEKVHLRFPALKRRREPDLVYVSPKQAHIIKKAHIEGPPELVIEVVSEDSPSRDYRTKFVEYEAAGVLEYWIIDPLARRVEAYALGRDGRYKLIDAKDGRTASRVLKGFYLRSEWLWERPLPSWLKILREMKVI